MFIFIADGKHLKSIEKYSTFYNTFKNVVNLHRVYDEGCNAFTSLIDQLCILKLHGRAIFSPELVYNIKIDATNYSKKDIAQFGGKKICYLVRFSTEEQVFRAVPISALT